MWKKYVQDIKSFIKMTLQIARRADCIIFYCYAKILYPVNDGKVLFLSDSRETLSGNFQYIFQELEQRGYDSTCIFKKNLKEKRTVAEKWILCKEMAQANYILLDDFYPLIYPIPIRKKTRVIQAWHAMGAFKTVGFSRTGKQGGPGRFTMTHRNYTDAVVSSDAVRINYAEAFRMPVERILATGIPRTDVFFDKDYIAEVRKHFYEKYPVLKGKKVILFAPTFRGNGQMTAHYPYEWFDFERIEREFSKEYICILKIHPFVQNPLPGNLDDSFYLNLTSEREINDLLFLTDVLVTDYSSVIFEASLLKIHTVFYVPDLEEYIRSRDFYYPFHEYTYGPVAKDMNELVCAIKNRHLDEKKLDRFCEKFCSACDGHSVKRFVDELIKR